MNDWSNNSKSNSEHQGKKVAVKENPNKKSFKLGKNVDQSELSDIPSVLRSRYSFYAEPPTKISEAQTSSKKRLKQFRMSQINERERKIQEIVDTNSMYSTSMMSMNKSKKMTLEETEKMVSFEKERHERLIGQLKAAEARNRVRILKTRYVNCKQDEIETLIDSQQSALKAVRLEAFLPNLKHAQKSNEANVLNPIERRRLDALIDDPNNSLIERKLY